MTKAATASVVIPTRDAGPEFAMILDVVAKAGAREIVVVDSGSLDGTPQLARERGAHVHEIEPAQFDHGRTRNLGVELSSGDFVAFLSQDARPREPSWLSVLLGPFADPRVAATYARVVPRDDASPLVKRSVASDPAFCADSRDQRIENPADWNFESAHDRRVTCHFNNVASCVRRDLLLETPFPEVEFGEDIAWAQHVMLQGWTIGYRAAAVVVHSHGSDLAGDYRRHRADAALHSALFDQILSRRQIAAICASEVTRDLRTLADASAAQRVSSALYSPLLRGAQALGRLAGSRRGASRAPSEMAAARAPETSSFISLFDADFYCAQRPAGLGETLDPLTHYLEWGDEQGLWPHPLFDPAHYGGQYPELEPRAGKRLAHFAETRIGDLASPHPLIDPGWMISQDEALAERDDNILDYYVARGEHEGRRPHPLFDPVWYRKANPDLAGSSIVLHHYAHHGAREGRAPCALFDARFYQAQCPEVATAGRFAIEHYRWRGDADDLSPHPLFDPAHYAAQFPELERGRAIRLLHYESNTRAGGGDPHPLFSTRWYCECSGQRDDDPRTPIVHYLEEGEASGCRPHPLFDPDFYRERYPRVARSVDCLLVHYVLHGGREGCDPNPLFDSCWYIAHTPALADSSENPLLHYLAHPERRCSPHPFFDAAWYEACHRDVGARGQDPLEYFLVEGARRGDDPHPLFDSARYREVLALDANKVAIFHYLASRAPTGALHEGPATWPLFD
ncbi:MAG: glycosyltransferase, partial [bacterium]|nr:glycosyltransferase [bacterium]